MNKKYVFNTRKNQTYFYGNKKIILNNILDTIKKYKFYLKRKFKEIIFLKMPNTSILKIIGKVFCNQKGNYQIVLLYKAVGSFDQILFYLLKDYNVLMLRCYNWLDRISKFNEFTWHILILSNQSSRRWTWINRTGRVVFSIELDWTKLNCNRNNRITQQTRRS